MEQQYVDIGAIASHFGVTPGTITAWRKRLGLPAHRFSKGKRGGLVLFKLAEVEQWVKQFRRGHA